MENNKRNSHSHDVSNLLLSIIEPGVTIFVYLIVSYLTGMVSSKKFVFDNGQHISVLLISVIWYIAIQISLYPKLSSGNSIGNLVFRILIMNMICAAVLCTFITFIDIQEISLNTIIVFVFINTIIISLIRFKAARKFRIYRSHLHEIRNIIIYANSKDSIQFIENILRRKESGYRILFILTDSNAIKKQFEKYAHIYPSKSNILSLAKIDMVDEMVYLSLPDSNDHILNCIELCCDLGITFRIKEELNEILKIKGERTVVYGILFISVCFSALNKRVYRTRIIFESILAAMILFVFSPLFLALSVIIRLNSNGPVIHKELRVGLRRRKFYMYNFTTRRLNRKFPDKSISFDSFTAIGLFLYKTGFYKIPRLVNILMGEMSFTGPKPQRPIEVVKFRQRQLKNLSVKPGFIFLWRNNQDGMLIENHNEAEIENIKNNSRVNDLVLFIKIAKRSFYRNKVDKDYIN